MNANLTPEQTALRNQRDRHAAANRDAYRLQAFGMTVPALDGEVVTQGHADWCAEHGHSTHTVDGVVQERCPRCGDLTAPAAFQPPRPADLPIKYQGAIDPMAVHRFQGRPFTYDYFKGDLEVIVLNTDGIEWQDLGALSAWASQALYNTGHGPHYRARHAHMYAGGTARVLFS